MQELRIAGHWVNQEGWDALGEGVAESLSATSQGASDGDAHAATRTTSATGQGGATKRVVDLRLDWDAVKRQLAKGAEPDASSEPTHLDRDTVLRDYALDS